MNISACASQLLTYFSPEEREIPDNSAYPGRNAAVLKAMNEALQELFGRGKPWVRKDERGAALQPPATIPITVTNGSKAAVIAIGDWKPWFAGCTIVVAGSAVDNQIRNDAAAVNLKFPHDGPSGVTTAIIYHDSVEISDDVLEVHEPVRLNRVPLSAMGNAYARTAAAKVEDYGMHLDAAPAASVDRVANSVGTPACYSVDNWSPSDKMPPKIRLRLYPSPSVSGFLDYSVMLRPPSITSITSNDDLPVPFGFVESIFMPVAIKKLRGCPFWRGIIGDADVNDAYQSAIGMLEEGNPRKKSGIRFISKF